MNILYAVQGTGNGHVARARHLIPLLAKHAEVDVWISGTESQLNLPGGAQRSWSGISLKYNAHGGLSITRTLFENRWLRFVRDVFRVPIHGYDLIVNDFEPVSAWAVWLRGGSLLELSHQAGVRHPLSPRPKQRNALGEWILKNYAPSRQAIGFHVQAVAPGVHPPLIRSEVRTLKSTPGPRLLVYLPAYSADALAAALADCPVPVTAFVPQLPEPVVRGAFRAEAVTTEAFLTAFAASDSVLCSAGFELPTEALFHGKRLAVIPIKGQYEQECNAAALRKAGAWHAPSLTKLKLDKWLASPPPQPAQWPDYSEDLIHVILSFAPQRLAASN
jgi:uncharacterized protein (TIGR00661 family)